MLTCPVCQSPLSRFEKHYACDNNHTFDMAKQGYVNLLLSNQKKTLQPGDNKEMVRSRLDFLNKHHYLPVANWLNDYVATKLVSVGQSPLQIADLGCGVGYYLTLLKQNLSQVVTSAQYWGVDISKEAIHCASGQAKDISWIVSSTKKLPFASNSFDLAICVFAPSYFDEIARILNANGRLIIVTPGSKHLKELKDKIYDEVSAQENISLIDKAKDHFNFDEQRTLTYPLMLQSQADIQSLIKMTPFYWHLSPEDKAYFFELAELSLTIDMVLWSFVVKN